MEVWPERACSVRFSAIRHACGEYDPDEKDKTLKN